MPTALNELPCELWYEPIEPGSQSPILRDPHGRIPDSQLKAWQRELDANVEQLRQDKAATVSFQVASVDWPTLWRFEDHTQPRARIPRIRLVGEPHPRYSAPVLRGPNKQPLALPAPLPRNDWVLGWLDDVRAALTQPPTDHVAEACVDYALESLKAIGQKSPRELALMLFESHLIFAIWKAQQHQEDERSCRLAIALQEVLHQTVTTNGDDTQGRAPSSTLASAFVAAIQKLVNEVLPSRKPTAAS